MSAAMQVFGGKAAVVTGAGHGIGEGLARFAAGSLGMAVVVADIDTDAADAVRDDIVAAGGRALAVGVDVRDPASVDRLADAAYEGFGRVDLLVNNAGVLQFGYLWDVPEANWQRIVDINISGVFHGIRSFIPRMIAAGGGHIWNLASVGAVSSIARQAPYLMSKHAVLGMTEALKLDLDHAGAPITVAAVLPGAVASQIFTAATLVDAEGDIAAAEAAQRDMLALLPHTMDAETAARNVFEQAADGQFYLLPQPKYAGEVMRERGEQLAARRTPTAPQRGDLARFRG